MNVNVAENKSEYRNIWYSMEFRTKRLKDLAPADGEIMASCKKNKLFIFAVVKRGRLTNTIIDTFNCKNA